MYAWVLIKTFGAQVLCVCVCVRERERERQRERVRVKEVITSNTQNYWSTLRPLFHYYDPRLLGYTLR